MRRGRRVGRRSAQAGFTLIELIVGIALMGVLSAGLLMAMRNGLMTLERVNTRLDENRRAVGTLSLIRRQVAAAIPARGICPARAMTPVDIFGGNRTTLLLVTSESLTQGARGYPQIARYQFVQNPDGTVRLEVIEVPFSGPYSVPICPPDLAIPAGTAPPLVLYDRLAGGGFSYQQADPYTRQPLGWTGIWPLPYMPSAVRIEIIPAASNTPRLPVASITVPLLTSREPNTEYKDEILPPQ